MPSAVGGQPERPPGSSSSEGAEKQPGKCWAEKARERAVGGGEGMGVCYQVLLGRKLSSCSRQLGLDRGSN